MTDIHSLSRLTACIALIVPVLTACEDDGPVVSEREAVGHVELLAPLAGGDRDDIAKGLPAAAPLLAELWKDDADPSQDLKSVRRALSHARDKTQDLRVAKATFFAVCDAEGRVLRNDREQDRMAGATLLGAFPKLAEALGGGYVETTGDLPEARGVANKADGQWIAAQGIKLGDVTKGAYVAGWAWSEYAHRLSFMLRGEIRKASPKDEPLTYVYMVVGKKVIGTPEAPEVNADAIGALDPLGNLGPEGVFRRQLEITGRAFGLAVKPMPALGEGIGVAVLRSET